MDLNTTIGTAIAALILAALGWLTGLLNTAKIARQIRLEKERHETMMSSMESIHVLVNSAWNEQMTNHTATLREHAATVSQNSKVMTDLLGQLNTAALTAEIIRKDTDLVVERHLMTIKEQAFELAKIRLGTDKSS